MSKPKKQMAQHFWMLPANASADALQKYRNRLILQSAAEAIVEGTEFYIGLPTNAVVLDELSLDFISKVNPYDSTLESVTHWFQSKT